MNLADVKRKNYSKVQVSCEKCRRKTYTVAYYERYKKYLCSKCIDELDGWEWQED